MTKDYIKKYLEETGDSTPTVVVSTASPYKFARSVMMAIDEKYDSKDDFELIEELNKISNVAIPKAIREIMDAEIVHNHVCDIDKMEDAVKGFLNI